MKVWMTSFTTSNIFTNNSQFSWIPEEQDKFTVIQKKNGIFVVIGGRIVCFFSIILNGIQRNDRNVSAMVDIYTDKEKIET